MWSLQSILSLARQWGEFKVTEANISMLDFTRAMDEGRVYEAFGAGTAAVVSPIKRIQFRGKVSFPRPTNHGDCFIASGAAPAWFCSATTVGVCMAVTTS